MTHGPQADEIRKAEKMTDKPDTSPEAVERFMPAATMMANYASDNDMKSDSEGEWVRYDDYADLSARVAELEERYLAVVGDKINLRGEVATLEAKLARAMRSLTFIGCEDNQEGKHARATLAEIQTETKEQTP